MKDMKTLMVLFFRKKISIDGIRVSPTDCIVSLRFIDIEKRLICYAQTCHVLFLNLTHPGRLTWVRPRLHFLESPLVCASFYPYMPRPS
jgi:hypothetical protein